MKKYFFSAVCLCLCAGFAFMGCKKDDDGPGTNSVSNLTAKVESGSTYNSKIDIVKALMEDNYAAATGNYANGEFTLDLSGTVSSKYLDNIGEDLPKGVKVSDESVIGGFIDIIVGYKSGDRVGTFYYEKVSSNSETWAIFLYVDKDVTITGSGSDKDGDYTDNYTFNISLKKGWNMIYETYSENGKISTDTYTTSDPGGLKWYFDDDSDYKSYQSVVISKSKIAGMFKNLK